MKSSSMFLRGIRDGIPIGLGYFAVAVSLGIAARGVGLTPLQALVCSALNNASAGEFAALKVMGSGGGYLQVALMTLIANARYLLMSCALSQRFAPETGLGWRMLVGFDVTDEIFGISMATEGRLDPRYPCGAMLVAIPGWAVGTMLGVIMGNVLPARIVSALSVALYGMFIAIIIPPARKSRVIAGVVVISMLLSTLVRYIPALAALSAGTRVIILTVLISAGAALLFPVRDEDDGKEEEAGA